MRHNSTGILRYSFLDGYRKVIIEVDPELHRFLRSQVPPTFVCRRPKYAPHITVVRNEIVPRLDLWGKYEGQEIDFEYETYLYYNGTYWWINCWSQKLINLRLELGLPASYVLTRPPDNSECFHSTVGNSKA